MRNLLLVLLGALALAACDPFKYRFESFVDHDIRDVLDYYGPVWDAYDRPAEGLRMFQWGREGPYDRRPPLPKPVKLAGTYEYSPFFKPETVLGTRNMHHLRCYYTVGARWHDDRKAWIVEEVETPAFRCEP